MQSFPAPFQRSSEKILHSVFRIWIFKLIYFSSKNGIHENFLRTVVRNGDFQGLERAYAIPGWV